MLLFSGCCLCCCLWSLSFCSLWYVFPPCLALHFVFLISLCLSCLSFWPFFVLTDSCLPDSCFSFAVFVSCCCHSLVSLFVGLSLLPLLSSLSFSLPSSSCLYFFLVFVFSCICHFYLCLPLFSLVVVVDVFVYVFSCSSRLICVLPWPCRYRLSYCLFSVIVFCLICLVVVVVLSCLGLAVVMSSIVSFVLSSLLSCFVGVHLPGMTRQIPRRDKG